MTAVRAVRASVVASIIVGSSALTLADSSIEMLTPVWTTAPAAPPPTLVFTEAERAWLAERHRVVVAIGPYPPYVFVSPDGEVSGISIDYLGEVSERAGVEFSFHRRQETYVEALDSMASAEGPDLMPCTLRASGRPLEFSVPFVSTDVVILTQINAPFIGGVEHLRGRKVATLKGLAQAIDRAVPDHGIEFEVIDYEANGLRALARGQVDAYIGDLLIASYEIQRMGLANIRVAAPSWLDRTEFSFGVRPDWPELRGIIDKVMASMSPGEHGAIRTRHVAVRFEHGIRPVDVLRWIGFVAGAGLALVILAVTWNRQLARRVRVRTEALSAATARLRALASELAATEERERRRLAADLHDQVGQPLALARVQLAAKLGRNGSISSSDDIDDVTETLLLASQETRRLISDLATPSMGPLGLAAAISDWMDDRRARSAGLSLCVEERAGAGDFAALDENTRAMLFRNVRELLTNVVKHAQATQVIVRLSADERALRIHVEDDGAGFDASRLMNAPNDMGGFGLFSITERMADLGGSARIQSRPGDGCVVELILPRAAAQSCAPAQS